MESIPPNPPATTAAEGGTSRDAETSSFELGAFMLPGWWALAHGSIGFAALFVALAALEFLSGGAARSWSLLASVVRVALTSALVGLVSIWFGYKARRLSKRQAKDQSLEYSGWTAILKSGWVWAGAAWYVVATLGSVLSQLQSPRLWVVVAGWVVEYMILGIAVILAIRS